MSDLRYSTIDHGTDEWIDYVEWKERYGDSPVPVNSAYIRRVPPAYVYAELGEPIVSDQPKPKLNSTPSDSVLVEAERLINGQRREDYGTPLESFQRIANYWTAYLQSRPANGPVTPENVAMMMVMIKIARAEQGYHRDSLVDIAGYAGCVELMRNERAAVVPDERVGRAQ